MTHTDKHHRIKKVTFAGFLVTLGIVFGDIGTSPLYAMSAIVGTRTIDPVLALGGLSAVFWTLTLLTTGKYAYLSLRADNNGEGGLFSLYSLIKRHSGSWLVYPFRESKNMEAAYGLAVTSTMLMTKSVRMSKEDKIHFEERGANL